MCGIQTPFALRGVIVGGTAFRTLSLRWPAPHDSLTAVRLDAGCQTRGVYQIAQATTQARRGNRGHRVLWFMSRNRCILISIVCSSTEIENLIFTKEKSRQLL